MTRDRLVQVRVSEVELGRLRGLAEAEGVGVSALVRRRLGVEQTGGDAREASATPGLAKTELRSGPFAEPPSDPPSVSTVEEHQRSSDGVAYVWRCPVAGCKFRSENMKKTCSKHGRPLV